ncbi:MAG: hypothetical protein AAGC55_09655 [Myxococcota bacterium]
MTRTPPQRDQPVRNMSGMFRSANEGSNGVSAGQTAQPHSPIERGVDMGYRVIEEQIRQGQQAAQRFAAPFGMGRMAEAMPEMASRMMRYWAQFFTMWIEMMDPRMLSPDGMRQAWSRFAQMADPFGLYGTGGAAPFSGAGARAHGGPYAPGAAQANLAQQGNLRVSVTTVSQRPTRVGFDLRPGSHNRSLTVQGLRAVEPDKPVLDNVRFEGGGSIDELRIFVTVADDQPEGLYTGWVTDHNSGETMGMLSVHVSG